MSDPAILVRALIISHHAAAWRVARCPPGPGPWVLVLVLVCWCWVLDVPRGGRLRLLFTIHSSVPCALRPQVCIKYQVSREGLSQKTKRHADSPPLRCGPPVLGLGFLVRSAEGLPSTRNWPCGPSVAPLPPASPPQVIPKAM
jgi:hypothetical protein